jgi:hypothetical protein
MKKPCEFWSILRLRVRLFLVNHNMTHLETWVGQVVHAVERLSENGESVKDRAGSPKTREVRCWSDALSIRLYRAIFTKLVSFNSYLYGLTSITLAIL